MALGAYKAIKEISSEKNVLCFLVTKMGDNASYLGGLPVRKLDEFVSSLDVWDKKNIEVLIGTPESVMGELRKAWMPWVCQIIKDLTLCGGLI